MKQLIIFSKLPIETTLEHQLFENVQSFFDANIAPTDISAFFITENLFNEIDEITLALRSSSAYWYHYIYTQSSSKNALIDARKSLDELPELIASTNILLDKLHIKIDSLKHEEKLLLFLYLRENKEIEPVFDTQSPKLYRYPIIDVLNSTREESSWISSLVSKDLITYTKLVDRVRLCTKCNDAHLYFVDLCPKCKSVDIKEEKILHCFACGYVEKEVLFRTDSGLRCPKCQTNLRLIGVDYDLPAAQNSCHACSHIFEEPAVVAKCTACGSSNDPDKLNVFEVHNIQSTLLGREYLLSDQKKAIFSLFSKNLKNIKMDELKLFLNWMISVNHRKNDFDFVVLKLEFINIQKFIEHYGFTRVNEMLHELSKRILELMRDTDMLSIDNEYNLWMLLPITSKVGIEQRLSNAIDGLQEHLEVKIKFNIKTIYSVNTKMDEDSSAQSIINLLQEK